MLTERFERLNALAELNGAKSYLEIGINKGETFAKVRCDKKVGVDPLPRLPDGFLPPDNSEILRQTSDTFFCSSVLSYSRFDLIYIDGLHTFEQAFRDFCASLACANENAIWLIDDTVPISAFASLPNQRRARRLRRLAGDRRPQWMGDVFKVVCAIHDFFPQFNYGTFPGHGQTVIWRQHREAFVPRWNSLEAISRLEYCDFLEVRDTVFNIQPSDELLMKVRNAITKP